MTHTLPLARASRGHFVSPTGRLTSVRSIYVRSSGVAELVSQSVIQSVWSSRPVGRTSRNRMPSDSGGKQFDCSRASPNDRSIRRPRALSAPRRHNSQLKLASPATTVVSLRASPENEAPLDEPHSLVWRRNQFKFINIDPGHKVASRSLFS